MLKRVSYFRYTRIKLFSTFLMSKTKGKAPLKDTDDTNMQDIEGMLTAYYEGWLMEETTVDYLTIEVIEGFI